MTFKIKAGLQVGSNTVVDSNSYFQQTESAVNIPPSVVFNFANKVIDSRITYARSSSGTYIGSDGYIKTANTNVPRFSHDPITRVCKGLLVEDTRVNLRQYSSYLGNYSGNALYGLGVATRGMDSAVVAPDGVSATCKITSTGGNFSRIDSSHAVSAGYYTFSFFVKANSIGFVYGTIENYPANICRFWGNLTTGASGYSISAGTITATTTMQQYPNGWWRYIISVVIPSAATYNFYMGPSNTYSVNTSNLGDSINVWGDQLENINFVSSYIPNTKTFTSRGSTGRIYNSGGVLQSISSNVERWTYNPANLNLPPVQLFEDQATNLLLWSEDLSQAFGVWGPQNSTITTNQTTAPDGNTTADLWTRSSTAAAYVFQPITKAASAITYTTSFYVKKSVGNYCSMRIQGTYPARADVVFDISVGNATSGTIVSTATATSTFVNPYASIAYINNGWYRISLTATSDTATLFGSYVSFSSAIGVVDATDSASNSAGYIWGAQLETGDTYTSYIPTTTGTATRNADVFTAPTTTRSFDNVYVDMLGVKSFNQNQGTIAAEFYSSRTTIAQDNYPNVYMLGGNNGQISLYGNGNGAGSGTDRITGYGITVNGVQQVDYVDFVMRQGLNKSAHAFATNSAILYGNETALAEDTSVVLPNLRWLYIASGWGVTGSCWNDCISSISYYPKRLSNNILANLTTF